MAYTQKQYEQKGDLDSLHAIWLRSERTSHWLYYNLLSCLVFPFSLPHRRMFLRFLCVNQHYRHTYTQCAQHEPTTMNTFEQNQTRTVHQQSLSQILHRKWRTCHWTLLTKLNNIIRAALDHRLRKPAPVDCCFPVMWFDHFPFSLWDGGPKTYLPTNTTNFTECCAITNLFCAPQPPLHAANKQTIKPKKSTILNTPSTNRAYCTIHVLVIEFGVTCNMLSTVCTK